MFRFILNFGFLLIDINFEEIWVFFFVLIFPSIYFIRFILILVKVQFVPVVFVLMPDPIIWAWIFLVVDELIA